MTKRSGQGKNNNDNKMAKEVENGQGMWPGV
jgi:hypothetical protein